MKFVDDLSIAVKVSLKNDIVQDLNREKPLTFDQRLETKISDSSNILQMITDQLLEFSSERQMKINSTKSCVMKICKSRTKAFPTEINIDENYLELKKEMKVLGVILQPDLKWASNSAYICKKAYKNMWVIRRMKILGVDTFTMVDYYMKEIRVHLELAVPVWNSGLTYKLSADIERVQRVAVSIMLSNIPYEPACARLGLKPLAVRRLELCERFALSTTKGRHSELFQLEIKGAHNTRSEESKYREHICHKSRFYKSPLPFLTRILNQLSYCTNLLWIPVSNRQ